MTPTEFSTLIPSDDGVIVVAHERAVVAAEPLCCDEAAFEQLAARVYGAADEIEQTKPQGSR